MIRKLAIAIFAVLAAWQIYERAGNHKHGFPTETAFPSSNVATTTETSASDAVLTEAYQHHRSGVQVRAEGVVSRILPDDNQGSRHQRFLVRMTSGQSILIAHNLDLAPRVEGLQTGSAISFSGEYEWNERGGVVHWTHRDPSGRHTAGWIRYRDREYR